MSELCPTTQSVIDLISQRGYAVTLGRAVVVAVHLENGERFMVRGGNLYGAVCELAGQVGVELGDG